MTKSKPKSPIPGLIHTSVEDCRQSLEYCHDPKLLCDLLIECNRMKHTSREQVVRRRISKLIKS